LPLLDEPIECGFGGILIQAITLEGAGGDDSIGGDEHRHDGYAGDEHDEEQEARLEACVPARRWTRG
jgi:hypothetical protein